MSWLVCGTVPDDSFPVCFGSWRADGAMLEPVDVQTWEGGGEAVAVPVRRGTPALAAAADLACGALGAEPPLLLLAGDCGTAVGSLALYRRLADWLASPESEELEGITFHYLFPDVDGHNRILMALQERRAKRPLLFADAGFMYAAKMSGCAREYDVFTPDAGELAFLADEKAPHPFYTRGFLLSGFENVPRLIGLCHGHGDSARTLLVKGRTDMVVRDGEIVDRIDSPCIPFMEPVGGTGDLVTGLLTAFACAGAGPVRACSLAARVARCAGEAADPTPATQVSEIIRRVPEILKRDEFRI